MFYFPSIPLLSPFISFRISHFISPFSHSFFLVRTVLVALISFMPTKGDGAIGALDMAPKDRVILAKKSPNFVCEKCGKKLCDVLNPVEPGMELNQLINCFIN